MAVKASASITLSSIRDLQSCTRYYKLQSSTLSPPSKPTTNPPATGWTTSEPGYTTGSTNSLYICDLNIFTDGDYAYSDVSLSSSYEAAKAAYNKAQNAQDIAEGIEVGGRNLARNTSSEWSEWYTPIANSSNINSYMAYAYLPEIKSAGDVYTSTVEIEFSGVTAGTGGTFNYHMQGNVDGAWSMQNIWRPIASTTLTTPPQDGVYHYSWTVSLHANAVNGTKFGCGFRCDYWGSGSFRWRLLKVEKGNRATDWTPAPEDVDAATAAARETAETAQNAASAAQSKADAARADFQRVVRIDANGLHIGDNQTTHELRLSSDSMDVIVDGVIYSRFAAKYAQFGAYQIREAHDRGLVFKLGDPLYDEPVDGPQTEGGA